MPIPTIEDLIEEARTLPEAERVRELCALICDAHVRAFWDIGFPQWGDAASACARAIRASDGVEGLEDKIRLVVSRTRTDR
jgi:hypothetical protein